jgi:hypothetical protein
MKMEISFNVKKDQNLSAHFFIGNKVCFGDHQSWRKKAPSRMDKYYLSSFAKQSPKNYEQVSFDIDALDPLEAPATGTPGE